jgi:hypothetical protein
MTILVLDVILRVQQVDSTYVEFLVGLLECFGSVVSLLKAVFVVVYFVYVFVYNHLWVNLYMHHFLFYAIYTVPAPQSALLIKYRYLTLLLVSLSQSMYWVFVFLLTLYIFLVSFLVIIFLLPWSQWPILLYSVDEILWIDVGWVIGGGEVCLTTAHWLMDFCCWNL